VLERSSPASPRRHLTDEANRAVSRLADARGRSLSHFGACAASTQAVGDAFRMVRDGYADAAIAGGMDSMVHPFGMISFMLLGATSTKPEAKTACKPFHKDRDGFLMGEGSAMFVLELESRAKERGATIYAEVVGYGSSTDGYNVTAPRPDGAGAAAAMRHALRDAGLGPADVGYVNAHGTGTGLNDPAEARAVISVFGEGRVPISSVKPVFGHTIAAAGALEMAACLGAIAKNALPPTPNLSPETVDPECHGLDHVFPDAARRPCPEILMTNNYGFGGQNASLLLKRV
jgi:3-oxoacyl-[acyl-carrier-protein] synthase II